jgi:hypothetical protein
MAICGCGLPAHCCQPAVAGGVICVDLWSELSTHLALQALFTQSSPVCNATATSFPLSKHTGGGDTAPAFSGLCDYLQFKWEVGLPPVLWSFPPTTAFTSFPAPGCWVPATAPALSGQARLVYLQFWEGFPSPPLWHSGCPTLFATCLYCSYCLLLSFSFFPGGGWSVQGAVLIWPRVVCGSTVYHLAHLVVRVFPSRLGTGIWWPGGPPGFSV